LQATVKAIGGVAVLVFSRDSIIQIAHRKYGSDAGYVAEETIGLGTNAAQMLLYELYCVEQMNFSSDNKNSSEGSHQQEEDSHEVVFEQDWLQDQLENSNINATTNSSTTKMKRLIQNLLIQFKFFKAIALYYLLLAYLLNS
jgi:hypothetical protein